MSIVDLIDLTDRDNFGPADLVVHFGIIPNDSYGQAEVCAHDDPRSLSPVYVVRHDDHPDVQLQVDGSWHVWGSDDRDMDDEHNNTLHVVLTPTNDESLVQQVGRAVLWLRVNIGEDDRIYDYALISERTWSERVATIDVHNFIVTPPIREAA